MLVTSIVWYLDTSRMDVYFGRCNVYSKVSWRLWFSRMLKYITPKYIELGEKVEVLIKSHTLKVRDNTILKGKERYGQTQLTNTEHKAKKEQQLPQPKHRGELRCFGTTRTPTKTSGWTQVQIVVVAISLYDWPIINHIYFLIKLSFTCYNQPDVLLTCLMEYISRLKLFIFDRKSNWINWNHICETEVKSPCHTNLWSSHEIIIVKR